MSLEKNRKNQKFQKLDRLMNLAMGLMALITVLFLFLVYDPTFSIFESNQNIMVSEVIDEDKIENGIHMRTGLKDAPGIDLVIQNCTNCHSAKLVTQNRMTKERWNATIRWMQKTQNLWELGEKQDVIVDYLVTNYPIEEKGRRASLADIDWYKLK
jgi:uncharacterized protein YjiS (DUF1127 family)